MGFGLHVGWAIEGAIGSDYKIDASYLSPNVNMASRLEAATKQFGVTMLLSDDFVSLLSPGVRRRVRQVAVLAYCLPPHPQGSTTAADATAAAAAARAMH
jgi:class 3 adenylate cyclase